MLKVIGCGIPASLMLKSKSKGLRIGYGMMARGEVAFITASIGVANGILVGETYSILIFVILATILISPTMLRASYQRKNTIN